VRVTRLFIQAGFFAARYFSLARFSRTSLFSKSTFDTVRTIRRALLSLPVRTALAVVSFYPHTINFLHPHQEYTAVIFNTLREGMLHLSRKPLLSQAREHRPSKLPPNTGPVVTGEDWSWPGSGARSRPP
jgi:hypothetical protein